MNVVPPSPVKDRVEAFLRERGLYRRPCSYTLLSGGNSHITWLLDVGPPAARLVVKVAQQDGPLAPYNVAYEAAMMQCAGEAGVPAPALIGVIDDVDTQFIVMEEVAGDAPSLWSFPRWLEAQPQAGRLALAETIFSSLGLLSTAVNATQSQVTIYQTYLNSLVERLRNAANGVMQLPESIDFACQWLLDRLGTMEAPPVLCHGDFRVGNMVFANGRLAALLDWERAMVGHPLHDVGFFCLPGMKVEGRLCGLLSDLELATLWPKITGAELDLRGVAFFRIVAIFGELCVMLRAMARLAQGRGRIVGVRALPLIPRLHHDLLVAIRDWNNGRFDL